MTPHRESAAAQKKKAVVDHIEDFIGKNLVKGIDAMGKIIKPGNGHEPGPLSYIRAYLRDKNVAALHPTTQFVINRILKMVHWKPVKVIVEYGPAEGVITKQLLARLPADGKLVAIELNPEFAATLTKHRDPRLHVVHGSVLDVEKILDSMSIKGADVIISGIPFSLLSASQRNQLVSKTKEILNPGGRFIAYQFTLHLIPILKRHFKDLDVQFEIRNLPPHFVFTGYKH